MKNKIFMYLFIFTALLVVFQYVNSKNVFEADKVQLDGYVKKIEKYKDSITVLGDKAFQYSEFSLGYSEEALNYIEKRGYESDQLIALIEESLYELNLKTEPNPLIPYAAMSPGGKMIINAVRVLNHKWVICNFNDGEYWGELFLKYTIGENRELTFEIVDSFLYPTN
ncbi:hydrolase [Oceanihabitans sp. 2_MG-2023]|uniref:hydrolase n=1 Tax=Oceanihabitans sp. 2_MG-2023 TaxID=3062661 RepID=UPI0026E476AA|nr:hydrolase [Oceanihabitans sp. 2_MG-2023]MDO6596831.1 hydrolase [Oceanihabitans sp. 2_MG-2023]